MKQQIKDLESKHMKKEVPQFDIGDTVDVHFKIKEENKVRIQLFSGIVIGRKGGGLNEAFTVRRISYGEGVERVFPLHSPLIEKIKVTKKGKVKRAKLYYLRGKKGKKATRVKEKIDQKKNQNNSELPFNYERKAAAAGHNIVAGIDEAGRGPLAGPVAAAAVIIRDTGFTERIDDSKKLTGRMREKAFIDILRRCDVGIGLASVEDIDRLNIYNATLLAMKRAVEELEASPDHLLIDGKMDVPVAASRTYLIRGESLSTSIACASIMAKVFRDRLMMDEDKKFPQYGFSRHKGYGTREHMEAIRRHGLCPIHRKTFGPFGNERKK